jgi:2-aminoadipate transaminase
MSESGHTKGSTKELPTTMALRAKANLPETLTIDLRVEGAGAVFMQIATQVRSLVEAGRLKPGMRLPPVRALARQLSVNPITVGKAYRALVGEGVLEGRRGGGTHVASPVSPYKKTPPRTEAPLLAERLFDLARAPGVIAFSSNYPLSDVENASALRECLTQATAHDLESCLHYEPPGGRASLRAQIARYVMTQGIEVDEAQILVTSGAQQGLDLVIRALVSPGETVVVERPSYYGAINIFNAIGAQVRDIPLQSDGLDLDQLETVLRRSKVRLIYVNPTFQNPTGSTMSEAKRRALLDLARTYDVAILEDDHAPELRFRGAPVPSLRALAAPDDQVFYARGFGKVFLPGFRLGFVIVPDNARATMLRAKVEADLHCNGFLQETAARYFAAGHPAAASARLRRTYEPRRRLLFEGLRAGLPDEVDVSDPDGGLSLWLDLPDSADASELYYRAVRRGVAFVSGEVFYAATPRRRTLRISFGLTPPDALHEGVERLCAVVKDVMVQRSARGLVFT